MPNFLKGMTFTMGGKEYEIISEGTNDPSSCIVYVERHEKETGDPQSLRMWKAEAKLARGDIMISGYTDEERNKKFKDSFYPPVTDPLEQIAELKKRILAIEERRLTLLKIDDPKGHVLLQDNVVKPNKVFNVWEYTQTSGDWAKKSRPIQYIKIRGIMIVVSANSHLLEHFLFNISDQLQPCCRILGDTLSSEGRIKIDLIPQVQTIQGAKTQIFNENLGGRMELTIDLKLNCQYESGEAKIAANISQAAYIRDVNAPGLKINKIAFPEIGEHMIAIEGICLDVYTAGVEREENIFV